jgi:hypothetical protein
MSRERAPQLRGLAPGPGGFVHGRSRGALSLPHRGPARGASGRVPDEGGKGLGRGGKGRGPVPRLFERDQCEAGPLVRSRPPVCRRVEAPRPPRVACRRRCSIEQVGPRAPQLQRRRRAAGRSRNPPAYAPPDKASRRRRRHRLRTPAQARPSVRPRRLSRRGASATSGRGALRSPRAGAGQLS